MCDTAGLLALNDDFIKMPTRAMTLPCTMWIDTIDNGNKTMLNQNFENNGTDKLNNGPM